jgi:hypothetical protein
MMNDLAPKHLSSLNFVELGCMDSYKFVYSRDAASLHVHTQIIDCLRDIVDRY